MISAEFTFVEGGLWFSVILSQLDYIKLLTTGSLPDGKSICAIKLFEFPESEACLIYDHVLAKKGVTPWRLWEVNV